MNMFDKIKMMFAVSGVYHGNNAEIIRSARVSGYYLIKYLDGISIVNVLHLEDIECSIIKTIERKIRRLIPEMAWCRRTATIVSIEEVDRHGNIAVTCHKSKELFICTGGELEPVL